MRLIRDENGKRVEDLYHDLIREIPVASLIESNAHTYAQNYADVLRPDDTIVILVGSKHARQLLNLRCIFSECRELELALHASPYFEDGIWCESARVRSREVILLLQHYFRLHRPATIEYTCTLSPHICYPEIIEEMQAIIATGEWWEAIRGLTGRETTDPENDRSETPVEWEIEGPAPMIVVGPPIESWHGNTCRITAW